MKKCILIILYILSMYNIYCQNQETKTISELNGNNYYLTTVGLRLTDSDNGVNNNYGSNENYIVTFYDTNCQEPYRLTFMVDEFDIHNDDTLFIYDGSSINSPLLYKGNNSNSCLFDRFYASSGVITIRFKSNEVNNGNGFLINILCSKPCQKIILSWDSIFYKTVDGIDIPKHLTYGFDLDSVFVDSVFIGFDTIHWQSFDICYGDRIGIPVNVEFPENNLYYTQSTDFTKFIWNFGDGDAINRIGENIGRHYYSVVQGYDIIVTVEDSAGCTSKHSLNGRVRIARNPIKTIFDLPTICNTSYATISVGVGSEATIIIQPLEFIKEAMKENVARTFVPDGPRCEEQCYYSPVMFTEFPSGRRIESASDICAICVNLEHEYMGDVEISIICPEQQKAVIKYKPDAYYDIVLQQWENPGGGGGGKYFGLPYGGNDHFTWDGSGTNGYCDSLYNIPGIGWNYCWSLNDDYGYWDENRNNNADISNAIYVVNNASQVNVTYDFGTTLPNGYIMNGNGPGIKTFNVTDSSLRTEKLGFYKPSTDFSTLIGCSLNGEWNIEVCDTWEQDNGWVFGWSMEICNINTSDWTYNVGIDTVLWSERTPGVCIETENSTQGIVTTPDTAGYFLLNVSIIDSFGCVWDTVTGITSVWTPQPSLGNDTMMCDDESLLLNADDGRDYKYNYSYIWSPTYETTSTINSLKSGGVITKYEVEVTNTMDGLRCSNRDDIIIDVAPKPIPNFSFKNLPFVEGCEPFHIEINNKTIGAIEHYWVFGDGHISNEMSPQHTYYAGTYDFEYYAISERGCIDSIKYNNFVNVYATPQSKFSWEPEIPTVQHPVIQFHNLTMPHNSDNIYYWKIQYDKDINNSVTTLKEYEPSYIFKSFDGTPISGQYNIELISITKNLAPSGNYIFCGDTSSNKILLINDFLQFPNVVTPNNDGINDIFEIKNLITEIGFQQNELYIYNRWGKLIYHINNITTIEDFWNPAITNSPDGTYFYRFTAKGYTGDIQRNGVIEVFR